MKFHALLCTRDEDDIIAQSVHEFLNWADFVHILDTGSSDETKRILRDIAAKDQRVKLISHTPFWFTDQARGYFFEMVRNEMEDGDWLVRTDSDEFYHISPPEFVNSRLQRHETCVYHQYYDFKLTYAEAEALNTDKAIEQERKLPIAERRQWYVPSLYSEPRMCRYRRHMHWPRTYTFPANAGFVAKERIPIRHYPNRDPRQMAKRVRLRQCMIEAKSTANQFTHVHHWRTSDWRDHLIAHDESIIQRWAPGQPLNEVRFTNHIGNIERRFLRWIFYASAVRINDRIRPKNSSFRLELIPNSIQEALSKEVKEPNAR